MRSLWEPAKRGVAGLLVAGALAGAGVSYRARHVAPYDPVLERVRISWPPEVRRPQPVRIGLIADTHIGPVMRPADVDRALSLLHAAEPDLLLLGGDYICASPRHIADAAEVLGGYACSTPVGAFAVLGNHDYANDAPRMVSLFERQGIRVLRNESARIATAAGDLCIVGIDDALLGNPDVAGAFGNVPQDVPALALWHEPDWAEHVAPYGAFLQLSGHSHGGQIRLPFLGNVATPPGGRRFVAGIYDAAGMPVYTTRGVGVFRPPVRFRCPPEVTLITLV